MAASTGASSTQDRWATVRYGAKLKDNTHYRIYSKYAYGSRFPKPSPTIMEFCWIPGHVNRDSDAM